MLTPEEFLGNMRTFGIRKEDRYDEPIIDDFIRSERCGICGEHLPSTVSHIFGKGRTGNWASSIFKMPKCLRCHSDWESLSLEEFEIKHAVNVRSLTFLWAEKIAQHLCSKIRELTGEQKPEPKKIKVQSKKTPDSIFKKVKGNRDGLEKCVRCLLKSFPKDEVRHMDSCPELQGSSHS